MESLPSYAIHIRGPVMNVSSDCVALSNSPKHYLTWGGLGGVWEDSLSTNGRGKSPSGFKMHQNDGANWWQRIPFPNLHFH